MPHLRNAPVHFPFPALICDVGGTNVRIAASAAPGDPPRIIFRERTADFEGLGAAAAAAARSAGVAPRSLLVCAAGPVEGARVSLTNARWTIDGRALADELGLAQGLLLNDFEAQAISLPHAPPGATRLLNPGHGVPHAARLVVGPGTGLGAAGLLRAGDKWLPATTEAGHISFAPTGPEEEAIWPHLERVGGRITFESVLSGPGIGRLYGAQRRLLGLPAVSLDAAGVEAAARAGDAAATQALRLFWPLLAHCAGDLALAFMARGGVTIAGGVAPRLVDWLDEAAFRRAFSDKAPMAALTADMPVRLMIEQDAALIGMAALAAAPDAYALDYAARAWRPA